MFPHANLITNVAATHRAESLRRAAWQRRVIRRSWISRHWANRRGGSPAPPLRLYRAA